MADPKINILFSHETQSGADMTNHHGCFGRDHCFHYHCQGTAAVSKRYLSQGLFIVIGFAADNGEGPVELLHKK